MKGTTILNSMRYEDAIDFSESIPIGDEALYLVFRIKTISIPIESSKKEKPKINILKKIIKRDEKEYTASEVYAEPVAYIVKLRLNSRTWRYFMAPLNNKHSKYMKEHKKEILTDFLLRQGIPAEKHNFEYM